MATKRQNRKYKIILTHKEMLHKDEIDRLLRHRVVIQKCDKALAPSGEISRLGNDFYLRTRGNLDLLEPGNIPDSVSAILESYYSVFKSRKL